MKTNIAIFASGGGTNAEEILKYFEGHEYISVKCILSNNAEAYVLKRAEKWNKPHLVFSRDQFYHSELVLDYLRDQSIDIVVLAGFLWLVPSMILKEFPETINIHPALLPKYGGKGMYGKYVHQQVLENADSHTGITIHYVNERYDEGDIILQEKCDVSPRDKLEDVEKKIHALEYYHYPRVIEKIAGKTLKKL